MSIHTKSTSRRFLYSIIFVVYLGCYWSFVIQRPLERTSVKLNFLKVCVRLLKDIKAINSKTYIVLEAELDEIGKMLGGWIKSTKER